MQTFLKAILLLGVACLSTAEVQNPINASNASSGQKLTNASNTSSSHIPIPFPTLPANLPKLDYKDLPTLKEIRDAFFPWIKVSNSTNKTACSAFLDDTMRNPKSYLALFMATGKSLNDYGDPLACRRQNNTLYILAVLTYAGRTERTIFGICGPAICKPEDYQVEAPAVKSMIANMANISEKAFDLHFVDPDAEANKIQPDRATFVVLAVVAMIIILGVLGSYFDIQAQTKQKPSIRDKIPTTIEFSELPADSSQSTQIEVNSELEPLGFPANPTSPEQTQPSVSELREATPRPEKIRLNFVTFCKCFSFYTNAKKLFTASKITDDTASTECLNGFRVLTMFWVILGHTYFYHLRSPTLNLNEWLVFLSKFRNQLFVACPLSVDSFLFLGGFLGSYLMVKELRKRKGKINFFSVLFHRYYRITPMYVLVIFFGWKILPLFTIGVGGFIYKDMTDYDCHDTWWSNIIFLNNFLPVGKISSCFGYTWYLAADMQCFLTLPIVVVVYYKNRRLGWLLALTLLFSSCIAWFVSAMVGKWSPDLPWILVNQDVFFDFYSKPYYRYGPYGVGLVAGLILSEYKDEKLDDKILAKRIYRMFGYRCVRYFTYIVGVAIVLWAIFINHPVNNGEVENWSQFKRSLYLATHRSIWVTGWLLIFLPAMMGWGSGLRTILGAEMWSPLARLTFGAYFVHPQLQLWYYWNLEQAWFIGNLNSIINCVAFSTISYLLSICFSLLAESPAMNLEKFWMPHKGERKGQNSVTN